MTLIKLNRVDFRLAKPTALALAEFWRDKDNCSSYQILEGIFAEYAVIKYLNKGLGASPEIAFNTIYNNGSDGGFDFKFIDNLKWDVKSTSGKTILGNLLLKTKADLLIGVQRTKGFQFDIWGFIPASRIDPKKEYAKSDFREIDALKMYWPDHFLAAPRQLNSTETDLTIIGPLIYDVMRSLRIEVDPEYRINRTLIRDKEKAHADTLREAQTGRKNW